MKHQLLQLFPLLCSSFLVALFAVGIIVPKIRSFALRIGAYQQGGSSHGAGTRIHQGKLPNIGGIAIYIGFFLALLVGAAFLPSALGLFEGASSAALTEARIQLLAIILGTTLMCLVGFLDDLWEVPAAVRLLTQLIATLILIVNGIKIEFITNYFSSAEYLFFNEGLSIIVTVLWVIGFTNAFNFIDGLDGLSSGISTISSMALLAVAIQSHSPLVAILVLSALAGASLGFLRHNFNPATIIMGDSGAYALGFALAAASVLGALKVTATVTVAAPILILALPVLNITQVTLRRLKRGSHLAEASNDHLHDLIRQRSGSHRVTVLILWLAALALAILGMIISHTPTSLMVVTVLASVAFISLVSFLRLQEAAQEVEVNVKV